jgi:HSP20 family protein
MVYEFGVRWIAMRVPSASWNPSWTVAPTPSRRDTPSWHDTPEAVVYELSVPGYRRKDLTIEVVDRIVTIRGKRAPRWFELSRASESSDSFTASFSLTESLDAQNIDAKLRAGVLTLTVAKKPHARARRIPVRVARGPAALPMQTTRTTGAVEAERAPGTSLLRRLRAWWHSAQTQP